jgi:WD40 repeat protein
VTASARAHARRLVASPDGRTIATWHRTTIQLWDVDSGDVQRLDGHRDGVTRVAFSADGTTMVSADQGSVRVWDLATGASREVARFDEQDITLTPGLGVGVTGDGRAIVAVHGQRAHVFRDDLPRSSAALRAAIKDALRGRGR